MRPRTGERWAGVFLALLLPALANAARETRFEATVDRNEIALDETVRLEISLQSAEQPSALELPTQLRDFEVAGHAESVSVSMTGSTASQVRTHTFLLRPRRPGALTIPSATCVVGGKQYATNTIAIRVLPASGGSPRPRPAQPPQFPRPFARPMPGMPLPFPGLDDDEEPAGDRRDWERELALKLILDKKQVWLGEQVTASLYLVSPIDVLGLNGFRPPPFAGFWSEEIETPSPVTAQMKNIQGVPTRVFLLKKLALFPTRAGRLTIDPAEIDINVQVGGAGFFPDARKVVRRSQPTEVEVRPLPSDNAPHGFQNVNVGEWSLEATVPDNHVTAGQPISFRLKVSGRGNVRSLSLPHLAALPGLKVFDPTVKDEISNDGDRFGGTKTIETVLVAERTGTFVLPPLEWRFFDPRAGRYEMVRTQEIPLEVTPGASNGSLNASAGTNIVGEGLLPIRTEGDLARVRPPPWRSPFFAVLLAGPVVLFAGWIMADGVRDRLRSGTGERRVRRAGRKARRRLAVARKLASSGEAVEFHAEVGRALIGYAGDKLGRPVQGLTRDELAWALGRAGAHPPAVTALSQALDACDAGRFGLGAATRADVLRAAEVAMEMLEEAEWRSPGAAA